MVEDAVICISIYYSGAHIFVNMKQENHFKKLLVRFSLFAEAKDRDLNLLQTNKSRIIVFLFVLHFLIPQLAISENPDTVKIVRNFSGSATLTTKGLSTFPNLTLGKPAAIFDFSVGGEKFRFEPTLRFALDGKPWSFIFWFRYELLKTKAFQLKLGAHPAYSFKTISVIENGVPTEVQRVQQFLAGEIAPVFYIAKNINIGPYYLYANGITDGAVQNSHFISLRANFTNINIAEKYFLKWMAQSYYLKMNAKDGFYINSTLSANRRNFPFSASSSINYKFESTIPGDDFLWNLNLTYTFGGKYNRI